MESTDYKPMSNDDKEIAARKKNIELNGEHLQQSPFKCLDPKQYPDS